MRLNIRWRLTLWNTLALAVVLLGFSALVYGLLARSLYARLDKLLVEEWRQLESDPRVASDPHGRTAYWIDEFRDHENVFCVVYDGDGRIFEKTETLAVTSVPPVPTTVSGDHLIQSADVPSLGRQRLLTGRIHLGDADYPILFMTSLEETDHELGHLLAVLIPAVPLALILGGFLAYGLARKAIAPVGQLHRLTEEITADRLDRRLPVANSGDEMGHLAGTINAMIGRLERSFAEIRRFTADASHELRTPLTAIRVETEVALTKPLAPAEYQHLLGSILEECDRLTRLTDQLLTFSREDARRETPALKPVDLAALVRAVAEDMRPIAESKGLYLECKADGALIVQGEEDRLRQVFYNLADNAIKYTPAGGTITIIADARNEAASVSVRDTGIGIPPEHLPRVFDRFYRVDKNRSRAEGGTGLGLSIARSIVHAHGGSIELESTPGAGTTCTVRLPIVAAVPDTEGGRP